MMAALRLRRKNRLLGLVPAWHRNTLKCQACDLTASRRLSEQREGEEEAPTRRRGAL